jgi:acyl carrier protein
MTQTFAFADLKEILVTRVGLPADQIVEDSSASFEDMGLDSLAIVEMQLTIQQQYGFVIPDEDALTITTQGQAVEYVNRRLHE